MIASRLRAGARSRSGARITGLMPAVMLGMAVGLAALMTGTPARAEVQVARILSDDPPDTLAEFGFFTDVQARNPAARVIPYSLNTPLFSDYALKTRYVFVPNGAQGKLTGDGLIDLPIGSALIKTFAYPADLRAPDKNLRVIETRVLLHRANGWVALPYVWNADQTQARLKKAGSRQDISWIHTDGKPRQVSYAIPNTNQCKTCHSVDGALSPIGPKARNLNGPLNGDAQAPNQLIQWRQAGLIQPDASLDHITALARYDDPATGSVEARARAYLDVNCAHCHNPRGQANNSGLFLNYEEPDRVAQGIEKRPVAAGPASGGFFFDIKPGDPDHSILLHRLASTDPVVAMPQLGRNMAHDEGVELVRAYIAGLEAGK